MKYESELRRDLVSGDWIVIAPKRGTRPDQFIKKEKRIKVLKKNCPFEDPLNHGNESLLIYRDEKGKNKNDWDIMVVKNKYPALSFKEICSSGAKEGPYEVMEARGYQDIVITRDHDKNFPHLDKESAYLVFKAFQDRYRMLALDKCLSYVSIFHNWGPKAGASVYHPHYQIIAIPVIPPDVEHSLSGSSRYYNKHKKCVHCEMIGWEKDYKKRLVGENKGAIAFTPYVSREPFEFRVFPKRHLPYFEDTPEEDLKYVAELLQKTVLKMEKKLGDPDYNFFIHTAPIQDKEKHKHYHWHIEIMPKISISAGFELGTGIEITVVDPDQAAKILR